MGYSYYSLILENDGTLWGCGQNNYGQLGLGDNNNRNIFTQVTTNDIKSVYCGDSHTFILENDGTLWGCGRNNEGQLGLGDTANRNTFTQITTNANDIKEIYCGFYHTLILKNDNTLWGCGHNEYGQLGLGDTTNRTTFTKITTNANDIKSVYCGWYHTIMLKNDGTLWGTGYNSDGQLGLEGGGSRATFTQVITNVNNIKSVYCTGGNTFILKNDGTLWGCGWNGYGSLGLGDTTKRGTFTQITTNVDDIKEIYCGFYHTFILKNDGTLWGCGWNANGQLGLGDGYNRTTFTQVTINADNIKQIYCGHGHTLILKNDGTLWGTGLNNEGELGLGDTNSRTTFTQITTNADDIKSLPNQYNIPFITKIYDLNTGLVETLDTNNFKNIPVDKFEKIKVLYTNPDETLINCLISFDNKATWKAFTGTSWTTISDITPNNILLNGMSMKKINNFTKEVLIQGGFTGNIDFRIALKTNDDTKTPSITKIYIEYKKDN